MARSSRLSVCLAIVMRNSSKIHCARSISRQRTTVHSRNRATLDDADDGLALDVVELGRLARRLAVQEAVRAALVEVQLLGIDVAGRHAAVRPDWASWLSVVATTK